MQTQLRPPFIIFSRNYRPLPPPLRKTSFRHGAGRAPAQAQDARASQATMTGRPSPRAWSDGGPVATESAAWCSAKRPGTIVVRNHPHRVRLRDGRDARMGTSVPRNGAAPLQPSATTRRPRALGPTRLEADERGPRSVVRKERRPCSSPSVHPSPRGSVPTLRPGGRGPLPWSRRPASALGGRRGRSLLSGSADSGRLEFGSPGSLGRERRLDG